MSSIDQTFKLYRQFITAIGATTIVSLALNSAFAQEKSDEELVKELSNPVASLISVPFQSNFEFNLGPNNDGFKYTLNFQPVIPFSMTKDWNGPSAPPSGVSALSSLPFPDRRQTCAKIPSFLQQVIQIHRK